jgi:hypothetical protein
MKKILFLLSVAALLLPLDSSARFSRAKANQAGKALK